MKQDLEARDSGSASLLQMSLDRIWIGAVARGGGDKENLEVFYPTKKDRNTRRCSELHNNAPDGDFHSTKRARTA